MNAGQAEGPAARDHGSGDSGAADSGMVQVPFDAFFELQLRIPRLAPLPPLDGSLRGWPAGALLPDLTGLHGQRAFARVLAGWSVAGLALGFEVDAPPGPLRVDVRHPYRSDGVELWCDTRDARAARRLTRFCHHFLVLAGSGEPGVDTAWVRRFGQAEGDPTAARPPAPDGPGGDQGTPPLGRVRLRPHGGYALEVFLPREALPGYAPLESGSVGLAYRLRSSRLGVQDLAFGERFPLWRNPGLWRSVRLEGS